MTSMRDSSSIGSPAPTSRQAVTFAGRVLQCINLGRSWAATHPIATGFVACFASLMFFALIYGGASSEEDAEVDATEQPALATADSPPPKSEGDFSVKERTEQTSEPLARSVQEGEVRQPGIAATPDRWRAEEESAQPLDAFSFDGLRHGSEYMKSPWRIESHTGLNDYDHQIDNAIKAALGEVSYAFSDCHFRGIRLCTPFKKIQKPNWPYPTSFNEPFLSKLPPPESEEDRKNPRRDNTQVAIDASTGRIVAVLASMSFTSIEDVQSELVAQFGKTPQTIDQSVFDNSYEVCKTFVIKYTFPKTLVRVFAKTTFKSNSRYPSSSVAVWVVDRSYVEQSTAAFANSLITACQWMHKARDLFEPGLGIPAHIVPQLVDTQMIKDEKGGCAVWIDPASEKEAGRIAAINEEEKRGFDRIPSVDRLVAGVGNYDTETCIVVMPQSPSANGIPRLYTPRVNISPYTINVCMPDMFREVASSIAQSQFPPRGETIAVIDPQKPNYQAHWSSDQPISAQVRGAYQATLRKRYEWVDAEGWTVSVTSVGIGLRKPR
jgi:hypothetical protein